MLSCLCLLSMFMLYVHALFCRQGSSISINLTGFSSGNAFVNGGWPRTPKQVDQSTSSHRVAIPVASGQATTSGISTWRPATVRSAQRAGSAAGRTEISLQACVGSRPRTATRCRPSGCAAPSR